jgi:hypothetical protein
LFGCGGLAICTLIAGVAPCLAGPPFFTDDPEPVELRHNEFYAFGTLDHVDGASTISDPAIEYNRGVAPNTQFHLVQWNCSADQPAYTLLNAGGYLNFSKNFSLLFSAGGSMAGAQHTVAYLGLYWTWASTQRRHG